MAVYLKAHDKRAHFVRCAQVSLRCTSICRSTRVFSTCGHPRLSVLLDSSPCRCSLQTQSLRRLPVGKANILYCFHRMQHYYIMNILHNTVSSAAIEATPATVEQLSAPKKPNARPAFPCVVANAEAATDSREFASIDQIHSLIRQRSDDVSAVTKQQQQSSTATSQVSHPDSNDERQFPQLSVTPHLIDIGPHHVTAAAAETRDVIAHPQKTRGRTRKRKARVKQLHEPSADKCEGASGMGLVVSSGSASPNRLVSPTATDSHKLSVNAATCEPSADVAQFIKDDSPSSSPISTSQSTDKNRNTVLANAKPDEGSSDFTVDELLVMSGGGEDTKLPCDPETLSNVHNAIG